MNASLKFKKHSSYMWAAHFSQPIIVNKVWAVDKSKCSCMHSSIIMLLPRHARAVGSDYTPRCLLQPHPRFMRLFRTLLGGIDLGLQDAILVVPSKITIISSVHPAAVWRKIAVDHSHPVGYRAKYMQLLSHTSCSSCMPPGFWKLWASPS